MGNRYLVVLDLHLADVEDHPRRLDGAQGLALPLDDSFAQLVDGFVARRGPGVTR